MEEINKTVDNFGVYIDNYHCDARDKVSCPRTLIVRHETQEVRIATVKPNTAQVEVLENVTFDFLINTLIQHQPDNYIHNVRKQKQNKQINKTHTHTKEKIKHQLKKNNICFRFNTRLNYEIGLL